MAWSLDFSDQERLVNAFLSIRDMRERRYRDAYVIGLEKRLGFVLPLVRHDQARHDVWQLVDTCLSYSGALHMLVAEVEAVHGGSDSMLKLQDAVTELLPEPLLEPLERQELHSLILTVTRAGLNSATLPVLYRQAVGPIGPVMDATGPVDVIMQLEEAAVRADGVPPLLVFVRDLAEHVSGQNAVALRYWVDRFAQRLGLDSAGLLSLSSYTPKPVWSTETAYLVIECVPDGADSGRYLTSAWLQFDGEPGIALYCEDVPQPLTRLPRLLESFLADDQRVVNRHTPELTIEFVLPRRLLNVAFDQLKISIDGVERRLGIEYPVVIRSHDRLRRQALHHHWRRKWQQLQEDSVGATICWVTRPREFADERLYAMLLERSTACLAMTFPPWGGDPDLVDELWVGLQAGAPVAIWCRDVQDGDRFGAGLRALLDGDLLALPQRVLDLRRQAMKERRTGAEDSHLGLLVTLVFDDADRLPEPYVRLRPPT